MCSAKDRFGDVSLDAAHQDDDRHQRLHSHIVLEPRLPTMFLALEYKDLRLMYELKGDALERDLCSKKMVENFDVTLGLCHLLYVKIERKDQKLSPEIREREMLSLTKILAF